MNVEQIIAQWQDETDHIISELLEDGSDPDASYNVEHHIAGRDFTKLEKAAVDAFKAGFEVSDAEELELDDGGLIMCFDVLTERELKAEQIKADVALLAKIADKHQLIYDGWGTYFEPQDGDEIEGEVYDEDND
ncbi:ribonuclease E inhibitor RraB [Alginatibacterium sediminis]|uniref:Regulator of ribonuclease activity B n=1 Tax=Alginatibacterium sediminis TaxID=2164068 RepID=A0A420ECR0_9ALTE|nr:ribonuclease E inhibitor RraB [Alginatibacterium sediminis]RKF18458.1 ribonuclease E inhibitor RraB [Alginatibacterium sediminis]